MVTESSISDHDVSGQEPQPNLWQFWDKGKYVSCYPIEDGLGDITLLIDWKAMSDAEKPLFRWMISVPNSIHYPGKHFGRLELRKSSWARDKTAFDVIDSRLRINWESPIFSPLPSLDEAFLSSIGPLEEKCAPLVLTSALQGIAHHLIYGPFPTSFAYPLSWHHMNRKIDRYLNGKTSSREEEGMRATAFFANAFTRDLEGLDAFGDIPLQPDCREASIMAIQELMEFSKIEDHTAADAAFQDVRESYDSIYTQQQWVQEDRRWALRIAEVAGLKDLATAAKEFTTVEEVFSTH